MDWEYPYALALMIPAAALLLWFDARTTHPMSSGRRRALLVVRLLLVALVVAAIASPARVVKSTSQAVVFVLDHSRSQGEGGLERVYGAARAVLGKLPGDVPAGFVSAGATAAILAPPGEGAALPADPRFDLLESAGAQTDLSAAVAMAQGLFPTGSARHVVLVTDGQETRGSLEAAARDAAVSGLRIHALPVAGDQRPDVRVVSATPSQTRISEGAALEIAVRVESSLAGEGTIKLYENGLEVDSRPLEVAVGQDQTVAFKRTPERRNIYNYRALVQGFEEDAIPENDQALAIVDVRGKPLLLYVEGEAGEAHFLHDAMAQEGIRLDVRPPEGLPQTLREIAGYDGIILSDVPAHAIGDGAMAAIRDYVEELGGGFVMIGGMNSFGVGGYYRTPIEEILPVKLRAPDQEETQSSALALVIDRSGSMSGQKLEVCKSAAIASAELLTKKDYIGVFAFDSNLHVVVPMGKVTSTPAIASQIQTLTPGGGTNIMPGMAHARLELGKVRAKIKHMIVLTDGQTAGQGYEALASQCRSEGITISTVAIGSGSQVALLQRIAAAGGGQAYTTADPSAITRIFTQDTMTHTGRMIREEAFEPKQVERHPMLRGWEELEIPPLLGYVKTNRKATSQIPLVTDTGDPLLAFWRFGLGKVTAFTSDSKSRWASLWISGWPGYSQFWSQVLRETARAPQGLNMDLRIEPEGEAMRIVVDLLEDAGSYRNDAHVESDLFFIPAGALGSSMRKTATQPLDQDGPGRYSGSFRPDQPGVYMVRARSGARMVSAGVVHNPSSEAATGRTDDALLRQATELTGGTFLESADADLPLEGAAVARYIELWPYLVGAMLILFFVDLAIRRWENVRGLVAALTPARP
ncbi:VWA domain-containing protein [soil metagenome]